MDTDDDGETVNSSLRWRSMEHINADFYRQRPHAYLIHRMLGLAMLSGRPDLVATALSEGIQLGEHDVRLRGDGMGLDDEERAAFLTAELEILMYHSAESLLRLVLAHARPDLPSPAINLAALNPQYVLYRQAKKAIVDAEDDALDHLIATAIHGCWTISPEAEFEGDDPPTDQGLEVGRANLRDFLRYAANYIGNRDYQDVYNSAKHGLAVRTGNAGFRMGRPDQLLIDQSGEALQCISVPRDRSQEIEQVTVWSNPGLVFGFLHMALDVMDQVWTLGRFRFAPPDHDADPGILFRTFEAPLWSDLKRLTYDMGPSRGDGPKFITMPTMRWPLGWVLEPSSDD